MRQKLLWNADETPPTLSESGGACQAIFLGVPALRRNGRRAVERLTIRFGLCWSLQTFAAQMIQKRAFLNQLEAQSKNYRKLLFYCFFTCLTNNYSFLARLAGL